MDPMLKPRKPRGVVVMSREDAADIRYRQLCPEDFSGTRDRLPCLDPYILHGVGKPSAVLTDMWSARPWPKPIHLDISIRCRKCANCLAHRRRLWTARAIDETRASNRTWFGTLTVAPHERFVSSVRAMQRAKRRGHGDWHMLDAKDQFAHLAAVVNPEVTKWLKRVRAERGVPLRYLLVCEAHKDGFPHYHLLIHEPALPVTERILRKQWRIGFSHFRLVDQNDPRVAGYVCKYLTKDALTRVRASVRYGREQLVARSTERLQSVTRACRPEERGLSRPL